MSRLRTNPQNHKCENDLSNFEEPNRGLCGEKAVIRCNHCKKYFCEECWDFHLHMTLTNIQMAILTPAPEAGR